MNTTLSPYLNFDGQTAEAMRFYQSVLGGELNIQTFGESGMGEDPAVKDRVIHAHLKNDAINLMASDTNPYQSALAQGNNVHLSLNGSDEGRLTRAFQGLAEGGTVTMPLERQFWGDLFGMVQDRYGINWMVNISPVSQ